MADYTFGLGDNLQFHAQDTDLIHTWNFGDGTTSTDPSPTHIYIDYGIYTVIHTAKDFCDTCSIIGSHTIEIVQASITVKSVLLDKYTAKVGDIITITVIAQNLTLVYGTGTVSIDFGGDVLGPYNVTLDTGQETSFTVQHQATRSGMIDICADNVCTALYVESQISVKSVTITPSISTGQAMSIDITVKNDGIFTEDKTITTSVDNILTIDDRLVSLGPNESQTYTVPFDPRVLPNGAYTICADGVCKAISVAIPAPTGNLNVTSFPDNAEIYLDGNNTGFKTPATITDILAGDHNFKISLNGYNDTIGTITILGGITSYIYTALTLTSPTTGGISISSIPTGAEIFLAQSGQPLLDQGVNTPATITDLIPGDYDILLHISGYQDYTGTITVVSGQTSYISAVLALTPITIGSINFTSIPDGAEIFLALTGQQLASKGTTPKTVTDLPIGTYDFELRLSGYNNITGRVDVVGGTTSYVFVTMVPISPLIGSISISSIPQGADIYLNNIERTEKTPTSITDLTPGNYSITLKKSGYNDAEITVNVIAGQTTYVGLTLIITKVMAGMFPWWLLLGLAVGAFLQKRKGMYEIDGKVPISLPPTKKAIVEQKDNVLVLPTTEIVDDKRKKLVIIPRDREKEPAEIFINE